MLQIAQAEAAIGLLDGDAMQAQLAHLGPQLAGEFVGLVDLRGDRRDLVGGEAGGGFADRIGRLAEAEFQGRAVVGDHARGLSMRRPTSRDLGPYGRLRASRSAARPSRASSR